MNRTWTGIQSGDIGFDQGGGIVGLLIRHFSHSPYAHVWVYQSPIYEKGEVVAWNTAEAYPGGLKLRRRDPEHVHRVARVWRNQDERLDLLAKSHSLLGSKYNYRELFRIIHYRVRKVWVQMLIVYLLLVFWYVALPSPFVLVPVIVLSVLLLYALLPLQTRLSKDAVICSNHVAQSVLAARPDVELSFPPQMIWPGRLERDLNLITWHDWLGETDDA